MSKISREKAFEMLKNTQKNACKGLALAGKRGYEYINSNTVYARIFPSEKYSDGSDREKPDFKNYTFEISSGYWAESTLKAYAGIE